MRWSTGADLLRAGAPKKEIIPFIYNTPCDNALYFFYRGPLVHIGSGFFADRVHWHR